MFEKEKTAEEKKGRKKNEITLHAGQEGHLSDLKVGQK